MKKTAAPAALLIAVLIGMTTALSACGSSSDKTAASAPASAPAKKAVVWDGTWKMDKSDPSFDMIAVVKDNTIEITWKSTDTSALYWKGTFPTSDQSKIVSAGDTKAMEASLLASQDKTKTFTYANDALDFPFTMMGVTRTIHLKK